MKTHWPFLLHQITRFGAVTVPQLYELSSPRFKKSTLYNAMKRLKEQELIARIIHPTRDVLAYTANPSAYPLVYGDSDISYRRQKLLDLDHSIQCTQTLIELAHYEFVTGIAAENELTPEGLRHFTFSRIPDGIVEITRNQHQYWLAVEVETSLKSPLRIKEVLQRYQETFEMNLKCSAVILVATKSAIYTRYQRAIEGLPQAVAAKVLLCENPKALRLNEKYFGIRRNHIGNALEFAWNGSNTEFGFIPMKSNSYEMQL